MSTLRLLDRIDDALNPIVVKELHQAVKSRLVVWALLVLLLIEVVVLGTFLLFRQVRDPSQVDIEGGQLIFLWLNGIMLTIGMLLIPAYAGARLGAERSDQNVDLLFISTLEPRKIIWGKFLSAALLACIIFGACAPFITFTYLLRGLDLPVILLIMLMDLMTVLSATMLTIFIGAVPANRGLKALLSLGCLILLIIGLWGAIGGSYELTSHPWTMLSEPEVFWTVVGSIAAGLLALMGLFFVWSVALISPPSSNRAFVVRIYELGMWIAMGAVFAVTAYVTRTPQFIYIAWQSWAMLFLFGLQFVISINERETWGPRMARAIPQRPIRRMLAFLFYSGSAGGILYALLMLGLTAGVSAILVSVFEDRFSSRFGLGFGFDFWRDFKALQVVFALIVLYLYGYGMTAILIRNTLFRGKLQPVYTWVLFVLIAFVGGALPYLFLLMFPSNSLQFEREHPWIILPNMVMSVIASYGQRGYVANDFDTMCLVFTISWAVLITLVMMPWFLRQVRGFRPLKRSASHVRAPLAVGVAMDVAPLPNGEKTLPVPEAVMRPGGIELPPGQEQG